MATAEDTAFLTMAYARLRAALQSHPGATLPSPSALQTALSSLPTSCSSLPAHGPEATLDHLLTDLLPACDGHALSGRYYGFVTGGCHPVAEAADNMVSALDQNVQVHLPAQYAATAVEDAALRMVVSLLGLGDADADWPGRTFTTGATASNVLGLLCGREAVVRRRLMEGRGAVGEEELRRHSVAEAGLLGACAAAGIKEIQVITSMGHSSLSKAASIAGLGHAAVKQLAASAEEPWRLSMDAVERELKRADDGFVSIIALSAGEVNTGRFATAASDLPKLRRLADKYGAWIHVDGAFGVFARALPHADEFLNLHANSAGLELADSIAADGHKALNVPYDNGIFLCRHLSIQAQVFRNPNAAYLSFSSTDDFQIPSPLDLGLENSRRFRALPVYALLLSEGREGMANMFVRMVVLARKIAAFIQKSEHYELLPDANVSLDNIHMIVLFKAKNPELNQVLVEKINETRRVHVSGTVWKGDKAVRIAVSNWRVKLEEDLGVLKEVLNSIAIKK